MSAEWTLEMDAALVIYVNQLCQHLAVSPSRLHPHEVYLSEAELTSMGCACLQGALATVSWSRHLVDYLWPILKCWRKELLLEKQIISVNAVHIKNIANPTFLRFSLKMIPWYLFYDLPPLLLHVYLCLTCFSVIYKELCKVFCLTSIKQSLKFC